MRIGFLGNFQVDYSSETHHANSLETLGHEVIRIQEPQPSGEHVWQECWSTDLFIWVHTHGWHTPGIAQAIIKLRETAFVPSITYHLDRWMGLRRQQDMLDDPYWTLDHFFTVDAEQARYLNENTAMRGHYLPPGVYGPECYIATPRESFDVAFIGSKGYHPEYPMRPKLIDWLHDTYRNRFRHYGGGGLPTIRGSALNQIYAEAKVVVGDSLILDPNYPGKYWSDRIPETLGRGGFLIHPWVYGLDEQFTPDEHLVSYKHGDFDELKFLIDYYREDDADRNKIRHAGHQHVKTHHTYLQRWQTILETVFP